MRLQAWKNTVRTEAMRLWPLGAKPVTERLRITVVYFHHGETVRIDNDNMVKPIQDALNGVVYADDTQITDTQIRKTNVSGSFKVRGMSRVIAEGFCRGSEFLYIKIQEAPDHTELL